MALSVVAGGEEDGAARLAFIVFARPRLRRVLEVLASVKEGRLATKPLLYAAFGRTSKSDHAVLAELEALGLIRRYSGRNDYNIPVVWNEITPLGRRVLEIVESMGEG